MRAEWERLGIEKQIIVFHADDSSVLLGVSDEARATMPDFDTIDLAATTGFDAPRVQRAVLSLLLMGLAEERPGGRYVRA